MRVKRATATGAVLLDGLAAAWSRSEENAIPLAPAPVTLTAAVSLPMAMSQGHGAVSALSARAVHDGETLSIRLAWEDAQKDDRIADLDRFADAAAVLFPLLADANPVTMGDEQQPVNAWLWKADRPEAFDVIARGYSTSRRRPARESGLTARGLHRDGTWIVVFQRRLRRAGSEFTDFQPGGTSKIAFAVWEGSNAERAGQKAVSGAFIDLELDR